jgi:3-phenylpropionate/cinnamic acid dioxygenase small subunit
VTFVDTDPIVGREAVATEMARRRQVSRYQDGSQPWHVITNVYIAEQNEREATVHTWWTFYVVSPDGKPDFVSIGYYEDVFSNNGDKWRIRLRAERLIGRT